MGDGLDRVRRSGLSGLPPVRSASRDVSLRSERGQHFRRPPPRAAFLILAEEPEPKATPMGKTTINALLPAERKSRTWRQTQNRHSRRAARGECFRTAAAPFRSLKAPNARVRLVRTQRITG